MNRVKEYLFTGVLCILFLIVLAALDDSYEDSELSAQVLDEAIAQAYADQKTVDHVLHAQQAKADF